MKILVDENIPYLAETLIQCGTVKTFKGRELSNDVITQEHCEALFVRSTTKVNEELLQKTNVKFVGTATSGTDHIDLQYLETNNIYFASSRGSNANSVAELVIYSILKWSFEKNIDLRNKTIGIIGFGNIGKIVADYSNKLGLKVFINDPPLKDNNQIFPEYIEYKELREIMSESDIITNHVPLNQSGKYSTNNLLNGELINLIKKNSLFIHASRGNIVEESVLLERLMNNDLTAVIDVWENEPLINIELAKEAMIAMPHVAGYSRDGKLKGALMMCKCFEIYIKSNIDKSIIENELNLNPFQEDLLLHKKREILFNTLKKSRDFENDHDNLLHTLVLEDSERGKSFDRLRKEYPLRRETLFIK